MGRFLGILDGFSRAPRSGPPILLSELAKGQRLLLGPPDRWRLGIRVIEPGPEIAMREEVHPQQGDEVRQRPGEAGAVQDLKPLTR